MTPDLLKILCCPETHQRLEIVADATIADINKQIVARTLHARSGKLVDQAIESGLVREDRKYLYPIRNGIPVLLIDEALPLTC